MFLHPWWDYKQIFVSPMVINELSMKNWVEYTTKICNKREKIFFQIKHKDISLVVLMYKLGKKLRDNHSILFVLFKYIAATFPYLRMYPVSMKFEKYLENEILFSYSAWKTNLYAPHKPVFFLRKFFTT